MPKAKPLGQYAEKDLQLSRVIKACIILSGKKPEDVARRGNFVVRTHYNRMRHPEELTLRELRVYIREINIPKDDIIEALYL